MSKILNKLKGLLVLAVCAVLLGIVPAGLAVPEEELLEGLFLQSQADFDGDEAGNTIDLSDDTADWLLHGGVTDAEYEQFKKDLENLNLSGVLEAYQNGYERTKA